VPQLQALLVGVLLDQQYFKKAFFSLRHKKCTHPRCHVPHQETAPQLDNSGMLMVGFKHSP
jgi:hypothetical protein